MANNLRLGGIASGMDTENIMKQMTKTRRAKIDAFNQKRTKNAWLQEAYNNANKSLANFILDSRKKLGLDNYTYMGKLAPGSIDKVSWAKKATTSNENVLSARATAGATTDLLDVEVIQLAKKASVDSVTTSLNPVEDKIGKERTIKLTVNGKEKTVKLDATDTYEKAVRKIRQETGLNVSLGKVGQIDGKDAYMFSMSTKDTGADQSVSFANEETKDFFKQLGVKDDVLSSEVKGQNSKVKLNSGVEIENKSNDISINGIEMTLKEVGRAEVKLKADNDEIFNKIKTFVEDYNKVIGELQDKLKEKRNKYNEYQPLTSEQKENMKEADIKLWEEKGKKGLLTNNTAIRDMISKIRTDMYEAVEGASSMHELGITTGSYKNGAKLEIDEAKLRKAIEKNPQNVLDTLFKSSEDIKDYKIKATDSASERQSKIAGAKAQKANTGIFVRIMDAMASGMESIVKEAGTGGDSNLLTKVKGNILSGFVSGNSSIEKEKTRIDSLIKAEEKRLSSYEAAIWKKFTEMEKAMQKLQSQSGWINQQFGGN